MTASDQKIALDLCVLTVSDSRTLAEDGSGDYLVEALQVDGHRLHERALLPDDRYAMRAIVSKWIADPGVDGILVTGGIDFTGRGSWSPRSSEGYSRSLGHLFMFMDMHTKHAALAPLDTPTDSTSSDFNSDTLLNSARQASFYREARRTTDFRAKDSRRYAPVTARALTAA